MTGLDETHDPARRSWLASANTAGAEFPIQNLPFGVFQRTGEQACWRGGVAIGDAIVDLRALSDLGMFEGIAGQALAAAADSTLNRLMSLGCPAWSALRLALSRALVAGSALQERVQACLVTQAQSELALPAVIGDYSDFYASIHHATRVGALFRPEQPLMPNYRWMPIAYHGRSSSIGVSPQEVRRPLGQRLPPGAAAPVFGPSRRLDYELELGAWIGPGNTLGEPVPLAQAEAQVFGLCLLNDWSARDLQGWESQPLGPFLGKSFATTLSPWIVTLDALAPYRLPLARGAEDPQPLPYLDDAQNAAQGAFDIQLEVALQTATMHSRGAPSQTIARSSFRHAYWTLAQMVAHHSSNGCNLRPGDLLGSGTQSGPRLEESGSLLELTTGGRQPIRLENGETRAFLQDGDTVILRAHCQHPGGPRIGFGESRGTVIPARGSST